MYKSSGTALLVTVLGSLLLHGADCSPAVHHKSVSSNDTSDSRTLWVNSAEDFCVYAPSSVGTIGDDEAVVVAYCTTPDHGTRVMPKGTLQGVHFVKTPSYVQVTGVGDFTKINVQKGDEGGELDPHGATGEGNPVGGEVFGNSFSPGLQYYEWTNFISDSLFCIRACTGDDAATNCQHIYDVMGCYWNMPADYDAGTFENCEGDVGEPMGVYGTSTWYQGVEPTPSAHDAPQSSDCTPVPSITAFSYSKREESMAFFPEPTPARN